MMRGRVKEVNVLITHGGVKLFNIMASEYRRCKYSDNKEWCLNFTMTLTWADVSILIMHGDVSPYNDDLI